MTGSFVAMTRLPFIRPTFVLVCLLLHRASCLSEAGGDAGAQAATDSLEALWCRYGLAGCGLLANASEEATAQTPITVQPEELKGGAAPDNSTTGRWANGFPRSATVAALTGESHEAAPASQLAVQLGLWMAGNGQLVPEDALGVEAPVVSLPWASRLLVEVTALAATPGGAGWSTQEPSTPSSTDRSSTGDSPVTTARGTAEMMGMDRLEASSTAAMLASVAAEAGIATKAAFLTAAKTWQPAMTRAAGTVAEAISAAKAGLAAAAQAVQPAVAATAAKAAQVPLWVLLLLGSSVTLVAAVQIWHCLPNRALLRRMSDLEAAAVAAVFAPTALRPQHAAAPCGGSVDVEACSAAPLPGTLASGGTGNADAAAAAGKEEEEKEDEEVQSPGSAGSPTSKALLSPLRPDLTVDPSVRFRDVSKKEWAEMLGQPLEERLSFFNPLFADLGSAPASPDSTLASPSIPTSSSVKPGTPAAAGDTAMQWQAKQGSRNSGLGRGISDAATGAFRLLAVSEPPSSVVGGPGADTDAETVSSNSGTCVVAPGSPGKLPRGQAQRKLTGARTIKPQELAALDEEVEGADPGPENGAGVASSQPQRGNYGRGNIQAELSGGTQWAVHASSDMPAQPQLQQSASSPKGSSTIRQPSTGVRPGMQGLRLLTSQQFKDQVQMSQLLGVGASGCVYAARWEGQQVAVKMLHPTKANERAFVREVETMAALGAHRFIVSILGACLESPLAVVQELAASTLHEQLHQQHRRPQYGLFMQLAEDVAAALDHCHGQRPPVIHRDLSARNVLLGMDGRARLADFGLAVAKRRTYLSADKAAALGTAAYMSPEAMQAGQITERCDVFSYGVLLWELLTGRQAWEECASPMQIIYAVGVERRRLPIPSGCPPALARLLKECWRHNAPLRPSFAEILIRLRKIRSQDSFLQMQPALIKYPAAASSTPSKAGTPKPHLFTQVSPDKGHIRAA